jgi:hypothetical protein
MLEAKGCAFGAGVDAWPWQLGVRSGSNAAQRRGQGPARIRAGRPCLEEGRDEAEGVECSPTWNDCFACEFPDCQRWVDPGRA